MEYLIYSLEDDEDIAHLISMVLTKQGYTVKSFEKGEVLLDAIKEKRPHMLLLDLMLPTISGLEVLKTIRSQKTYDDLLVIIVSAKSLLVDRLEGIDLGADDYISKPFDVMELIARVNAKFRRIKGDRLKTIGDFSIDFDQHVVIKEGKTIELTPKEFDILSLLVKANGAVVSRKAILSEIWGSEVALETRTIDMHVQSLRKKLHDPRGALIATVFGVGYKIIL